MLQNIEKLNDIPNIKVTDDLMRNERSKVRECQKITEKKNKQEWKRKTSKNGNEVHAVDYI